MICPKCHYIFYNDQEICKNCGYQLSKTNEENAIISEDTPTSQPSDQEFTTLDTSNKKMPVEEGQKKEPLEPLHLDPLEEDQINPIEKIKKLPKGGFWKRFFAFIVDIIFIDILKTPLIHAVELGFITGAAIMKLNHETFLGLQNTMTEITTILFVAAYFVYFHGNTGMTPGKWLFGLKVIKTDGKPLGFLGAAKRFLAYIISAIPLSAGFLMIAFNHQKQALHDIITRTYVIKTIKK